MKQLRFLYFLRTITLLVSTGAVSSVVLADISATVSRAGFRASVCNVDKMTVDFRIDQAFDEPLLTSKMSWINGPNTNEDCLARATYIWLKTRTPADEIRYIKLSPEVQNAHQGYGATATASPSWSNLFCVAANDNASCDSAETAQQYLTGQLQFEGFEVVTEARAATNNLPQKTQAQDIKIATGDSSLESLLSDAIDSALDPLNQHSDESTDDNKAPVEAGQQVAANQTVDQTTNEPESQQEQHAKVAMNNVVSLIASSLAQYNTPAHECESTRVVGNWVQARSVCQLNFRSESNHEYLCNENGRTQAIRSTQIANIDLSKDLEHISDVRVSEDGWAAVVLEFKDDIHSDTEGNYQTNRWQFTANADQVDDLTQMARSLLTLKQYCEANPS